MKPWRIALTVIAAILVVVLLFGYLALTRRGPVLTVVTWSGTYGRAQTASLMLPFARSTGTDVRLAEYDGGTAELARQVRSYNYRWDVVDLELPDAVAACGDGLLEPIDASRLPAAPNGTPAADDFLPGALGPCWVASVVYSQVIGFDPHRFAGPQPSTLADFFDARRFPGPRALRQTAKLNLELALLADGVPPDRVYATLSTPDGVARALAKLDTIRDGLVWWTLSDPPARMLSSGRAAFATLLNGDVFDASNDGRPVGVIWDRQLYEYDVFGIPKGDPKRGLAMDFIRSATQASNLGAVASWVPYGPARKSALVYVRRNPDLDVAMTPFLPTTPDHFATAFAVNDAWWRLHGGDIAAQWQAWVAKEK
jgi:putative spermidine/putrescine transport system substrate-binding protein